MALALVKPWRTQPYRTVGVNWSNPITNRLQMAVTSHSGEIRDIIAGTAPASGSGTPLNSRFIFGKARRYDNNSDFFITPGTLNNPARYTLFSRASFISFSASGGILYKTSNLGVTNGFGIRANTGGTNTVSIENGGAIVGTSISLSTLTSQSITNIVCVWNGAQCRLFLNGRFIEALSLGAPFSGAGYLKIFSTRDQYGTTGFHDHSLVWDRAISDAEAIYLTLGNNSYSLFTGVETLSVPTYYPILSNLQATRGNTSAALRTNINY